MIAVNRRRYMGGSTPAPLLDYLRLTAVEATTFTITMPANLTVSDYSYVEYSLDNGATWTKTNNVASTEVVVNIPQISIGDSVLLRGSGTRLSRSTSSGNYSNILSSGVFDVSGNIMSLLALDNYASATLSSTYNFTNLFRGSKVRDASSLTLYSGALTNYCYNGMFYDCTSLTGAPTINFTTAAQACCYAMFRGCTSLASVQASLPSALANQCFAQMYQDCTSLVNAPALPATTLATGCYINMFSGCSSLKYIKCMSLTELSTTYTNWWVQTVPAGGTFVKNASATWTDTFDRSHIPIGWTVETASS